MFFYPVSFALQSRAPLAQQEIGGTHAIAHIPCHLGNVKCIGIFFFNDGQYPLQIASTAGDVEFIDGTPHTLSPENSHRLPHGSDELRQGLTGGSCDYSQDDKSQCQLAFQIDTHHIAGGVSEGIEEGQYRLVFNLVDNRADHRYPDQELTDSEEK